MYAKFSKAHLILFLVSLGIALFIYHLVTPNTTATVPVLVTLNSKKLGDIVKPEDLTWTNWPSTYDRPHFIHTEEEKEKLLHQAVTGFISQGEPMTFDKVREPTLSSTLAQHISPEHRAVTLSFEAAHSEAGQLVPGDRVDILWTHKAEAQKLSSEVLAENILILATDSSSRTQIKLTFDMRADLAQKILLAQEKGKISFLLRGPRCEEPSGLCAISEDGLVLKKQVVNYTLGANTDQREVK